MKENTSLQASNRMMDELIGHGQGMVGALKGQGNTLKVTRLDAVASACDP